jgi:hypothetical protein
MGRARLDGWRLVFSHRSEQRRGGLADIVQLGSVQDNASFDPDGLHRAGPAPPLSPVWGVLWQVTDRDRQALHKKEGYAPDKPREAWVYSPVAVDVLLTGNVTRRISAFAYAVVAKSIGSIPPYHTYLNLLLSGARENDLPSDYVRELAKVVPGRTG